MSKDGRKSEKTELNPKSGTQRKIDDLNEQIHFMNRQVTRRTAISTGVGVAAGVVAGLVVGGIAGYVAKPSSSAATTTVTSTAPGATVTSTVTSTVSGLSSLTSSSSTSTTTSTVSTGSSSLAVPDLQYWTYSEASKNLPVYANFSASYAESNPGFQATVYNAPSESSQLQKWAAAYQSNTDPDFGNMQIQDALQLGEAPSNALYDMDDFTNDVLGPNWYFAPSIQKLQVAQPSGKIWGAANQLGAYFLYCNETILADAGQKDPTTIDEFDAVCAAVNNPSKGVYAFSTEMSDSSADPFFGIWLLAFGGSALNADNQVTFNSPETIAAVNYWNHLATDYGPPGWQTATQVTTATQFANGMLAMDMGTNYRFAQQIYAVPTTYAVTNPIAIPSGGAGSALAPNGGAAAGIYNPCYIVSAHTQSRGDTQEVLDYIQYILSPPQASQWQAIGYIPSAQSVYTYNNGAAMTQFDSTGKFAQLVATVRSMAINAPSVLPYYAPNGYGAWSLQLEVPVYTCLESVLLNGAATDSAVATATTSMQGIMTQAGFAQGSTSSTSA